MSRIAISLARALKHAHDRGVIHRDIKPANIMLTREGELKLSDFGIAKLFGSTGLTADGGVIGTAEYMAPEQADGRPVTYRSDLYSLGGVMYALLAGRPPFRARSLVEMLQMQRYTEPDPVRRYASNVPEEMEIIVQELLAKDPGQRIPNAMILARRLQAMEQGLARRERETTAASAEGTEFELSSPPEVQSGNLGEAETLAATLAGNADEASLEPSIEAATFALAAEGQPAVTAAENAAPMVDFSLAPSVLASSQTAAATSTGATRIGASRFVTVAEDEDRTALEDEPEGALISPQTWVLVVALVVVGLGAWYLLQPVSADRLYERVATQAQRGEIEALLGVETDIHDFLNHHPADRRGAEMRAYLDEIELHRAQRRFERQARGIGRGDSTSPVERIYLEAVRYVQLDPAVGAAKLQALIDVFGNETDANAQTQRCLELARHQLAQLRPELERAATEELEIMRQHLARADALQDSNPTAAADIYRGIIELCDDKPWAAEVVSTARTRLADAPSTTDTPPVDGNHSVDGI